MTPRDRGSWNAGDLATLLAILVAATGLRVWGLGMGLPHLEARPDETEVLAQVARAAAGHFDFDYSAYPHAYVYFHWLWAEFVVFVQRLIAVDGATDYLTLWRSEPSQAYRIGRALTALSGVASVALVFVAAHRAGGRGAAALAASLVAGSLLQVRDSHSLKPDVLLGLAVTAAVVAAARLARDMTPRAGLVAGLCVGAAGAAKYNGLVAAVPVAVAAWWGGAGVSGPRRLFPAPLVVAGAVALVFFVGTSPFVFTNPAARRAMHHTLSVLFPSAVAAPTAGFELLAAPLEGPGVPEWTDAYGPLASLAYHVGFSLRYGVGWPATLLAFPAIVWGLRSAPWLLRLSAVFCVAWLSVICATSVMLSRYATPMIPALAILEGALLAALLRRSVAMPLASPTMGFVLAGALLVGPTAWASVEFDRLAARVDTRVLATRWLEENTAARSRIGVHGTRFWGWGAPHVPAPRRASSIAHSDDFDPTRIDYLVTHDHELFWSSTDPDLLERNAGGLELLVDFDPRAGGDGRSTAVFESNDAFYLPVAGFCAVTAPGPRVRVYRVRAFAGVGSSRDYPARP